MDVQKTGALIAQRRKELALTQKELARQLHVSDRAVSKWERGVNLPSAEQFEPLCAALSITVLELLRGERSPVEQIPVAQAEEAVSAVAELASIKERRARRLKLLGIALACALLLCGGLLLRDRLEQAAKQAEYDNSQAWPSVRISHFDYSGKTEILRGFTSAVYFADMPYEREAAMADLAINQPPEKTEEYLYLMQVPHIEIDDVGGANVSTCCFSVSRAKTQMQTRVYRWPLSLQGTGVTFEEAEELPYERDRFHDEDWAFEIEVGYLYSIVFFWGENEEYFAEYAFRTVSILEG